MSRTAKGDMYAASTAVVSMELLKFAISLAGVFSGNDFNVTQTSNNLYDDIIAQPYEMLKLSVPALIYSIQNNLLYYALSHLDAATYSVLYNMKILTTAVLSVLYLNKAVSQLQWIALVILTIGVVITQYSSQAKATDEKSNSTLGHIQLLY